MGTHLAFGLSCGPGVAIPGRAEILPGVIHAYDQHESV